MPVDIVSRVDYNRLMTGFTKLFSTIIHSTIWREDMHIKVVWITMLAMADRNGRVWASLPGLADAARVSIDQCVEAIAKLSSPDKFSRTKDNEGRRITEIDGGWEICNYLKYREMRDDTERRLQTNAAVRRYRSKKANQLTVSQGKPMKAQAEAEAYTSKEREGVSRRPSISKFVKPTPDEVEAYIRSQDYTGFTGQQFFDHYEATGWLIGKSPMKSWHAAVRTWGAKHPRANKKNERMSRDVAEALGIKT